MSTDNDMRFHSTNDINISTYLPSGDNTTETLEELNFRYATTLLPFTISLGILGFVGIIGNVLVFIVYGFGKRFKDKKFRCYVLCLAAVDLITCLTLIPAEIIKHRSYFNFVETDMCKTKCFFNVFAASTASYCLLIVAIDRYLLTCHPMFNLKVRAFSHSVAWKLCGFMFIIGAITAVPAAIFCGIATEPMTTSNGNVTEVFLCRSAPYFKKGIARYLYRYALGGLQTFVSAIVIILYIHIGYTVIKVMRIRGVIAYGIPLRMLNGKQLSATALQIQHCGNECRYSATRRSQDSVTHANVHHSHLPLKLRLLFIVTIVFIVTHFLYTGLSWVDQTRLTPGQFALFSVVFRLYFIHSVINPFLYAKMDTLFRRRCIQIFTCKR